MPEFLKELQQGEATLGTQHTWEFEVRGKPVPDFRLSRDSRDIKLGERISIVKSETSECRYHMHFQSVESNDMGKYRLVASNKVGSATSEASLTVSGAPICTKRPDAEVSYPEKKNARIEFEIAGIPVPEVAWLKNGQPLACDNRVKTEVKAKTTHLLNIANVQAADVAEYTLIAENEAGKISESFRFSLSSRGI